MAGQCCFFSSVFSLLFAFPSFSTLMQFCKSRELPNSSGLTDRTLSQPTLRYSVISLLGHARRIYTCLFLPVLDIYSSLFSPFSSFFSPSSFHAGIFLASVYQHFQLTSHHTSASLALPLYNTLLSPTQLTRHGFPEPKPAEVKESQSGGQSRYLV